MIVDKNQEPPKIEFPCKDYPIKVLGEASDEFRDRVVQIMQRHATDVDEGKVSVRNSRNGNFYSVTVFITATGVPQLKRIFEDLKKLPQTRMVI